LGKLLVNIDNTELSNKTASFMIVQEVFVIKPFSPYGGSCVAVKRQYQESYVHVTPLRDNIYWIIKECEETESTCDEYAKGHTPSTSFAWKKLSVQYRRL
jgi:hypothetical protein